MTHPEPALVTAMLAMIPPDEQGNRTVNGVAPLHPQERARFDHIIRRDFEQERALISASIS